MPVFFREKKDTVQPSRWVPRIVSTRPPEIPATDLSRTSIARMSLPDERAARREFSPHTTRRAPVYLKRFSERLEQIAPNLAGIAVIFLFLFVAYWGTP